MPCEACNIQFTVFKRKKSCTECRRLYCSNCLTKNKERILCKRCIIFTTRPLSKIELLKLKAKDLIFYLQSKHISTTGCVEKEELVNLVLIHVDNSNNLTPDSQSPTYSMGTDQSDDTRSNPFDQIRSTCQNLFSTFTEKIAADFNFDFKQNPSDRQSNVCEDQPRYSNNFRYVPPFSSNASTANNGNAKPQRPRTMNTRVNQSSQFDTINSTEHSTNTAGPNLSVNAPTSPTVTSTASTPSMLKSSSQSTVGDGLSPSNGQRSPSCTPTTSTSTKTRPAIAKISKLSKVDCCNDAGSGCECSDDELITKFCERYVEQPLSPAGVAKGSLRGAPKPSTEPFTGSSSSSTKTGSISDTPLKEEASALGSSDISSFEDLGAVGGLQANATPNNASDADRWQIVNPSWNIDDAASTSSVVTDDKNESMNVLYTTNLPNSITDLPHSDRSESQRPEQNPNADGTHLDAFRVQHSTSDCIELRSKLEKTLKSRPCHRKITRRQSDGIVYQASTSNPGHQVTANRFLDDLDDDEDRSSASEDAPHKRSHKSCRKCGKTKGDLKKYIARFRHQLETRTLFTESEIKQQLDAFLEFLESHSSSSKDDESMPNTELEHSPTQLVAEAIELEEFDDDDYDDEAGIHVYGSNDETTASSHPPRQFFNLNSIEKKEELDELSVKQLKEVLMLNRIDFKGCCEKSELLERVQRLWDDLQKCPAVDKLPTVDLCKICMDAAIECVLLECGHMATCTNCGKVLSECPICRQYIVRVVRFFKA